MKSIGENVKELRNKAGMSADSLAEKLGRTGISRKQFVYDIEKQNERIDNETLNKLAKIFNVPTHRINEQDKNLQTPNLDKVCFSNKESEFISYEKKYIDLLEENSELKSNIIELMKKLNG